MSDSTLPLGLNLPRLHTGELMFLQEWAASRVQKFPHFTQWLCETANAELGRRLTPGAEAGTISLPDLRGAVAADFLMASFVLVRQPMTEGLAAFVDDLAQKVTCDISGMLEHEAASNG